jgi:ketopantoate hydroxymethyltransferase
VLVGDSLGMTMLGFEGTLPVTMDDTIRQAVPSG